MRKEAFSFNTIGLGLTLLFALVAELYRFHGILLVDLFVPLFVGAWILKKLAQKDCPKFPTTLLPALLFVTVGLASLLLNSSAMDTGGFLASAFYGVRWAGFYFLSIIVFNQSKSEKDTTLWMLAGFALLLSLAGFIQLKIMPDFTSLEDLGWDPHQNRLLSTWFDPNFVGGFLAFISPILLGAALDQKSLRKVFIPIVGIGLIALVLTLSRSAYLALITAVLVFGLFRSVKLLAGLGVALLLLVAVLPTVQDRFLSLVDSIASVTSDSYTLPDASSRLRFEAWDEAWQLFLEKPILGQGYNRYKYAALELGTLKDLNIHSASGSDSSLLNILATTGLAGFFPFLSIYLLLAIQAWKHRKNGVALGFLAGLSGLFVHSIFVNSLLFPLFMVPFWISAGLLTKEDAR